MVEFEGPGEKLDRSPEETKAAANSGVKKMTKEAKDWKKKLSQLGEKIGKTTQQGMGWVATETKEFSQIAKLRFQIGQREKDISNLFKQMGEKTYELHLQKKIGDKKLKGLGAKITKLRKEIETKKKQIQSLKERK